jgi:serine/arginine repetitive matrix protein 2
MPRPMTPRGTSFEVDNTSVATTPRAVSPYLPAGRSSSPISPNARRNSLKQEQAFSGSSHFITRTLSGRRTPDTFSGRRSPEKLPRQDLGAHDSEISLRSSGGRVSREGNFPAADDSFFDFGTPLDSSVLGARLRPVSPAFPGTYQPMAVPGGTPGSSRPSTPSNVTWKIPSGLPSHSNNGHVRTGSAISSHDLMSQLDSSFQSLRRSGSLPHQNRGRYDSISDSMNGLVLERTISPVSGGGSLRSPPLPDSPFIDASTSYTALTMNSSTERPPSASSGLDLSSSSAFVNRPLRSPTPTSYPPLSPTSPAFSEFDRSSSRANSRNGQYAMRQTAPSPFALSQSHVLLSPSANSSRSSLESAGSSYHSREEEGKQDRIFSLLASLEPNQLTWHDISSAESSSTSSNEIAEDIIQQHSGLSKSDFMAIQVHLISAANAKTDAADLRERSNSLRRRRPSTSQAQSGVKVHIIIFSSLIY